MPEPRTSVAPSLKDYLTIFWVSFSLLVFQVALTRVLSVVVWYHFAFLTLSMVMFGVGAPGVWFALIKRPDRMLPHSLFAAGVLLPLSTLRLQRTLDQMVTMALHKNIVSRAMTRMKLVDRKYLFAMKLVYNKH